MITHTVFLGPSMDQGPVVHMWGKPDDDENLHCEWADDVKWVSVGPGSDIADLGKKR